MFRAVIAHGLAGGLALLAIASTLDAQPRERAAYASIFDRDSRQPVTDLAPDDLVVREDGVRREVLRVTPATSPMPVAIVFDNSQPAANTINDLRRALTALVQRLAGIGPIALISVADRPTILVDYTTDQAALEQGASRVFAVPGSGATLLDAIVEVSRGLGKREEDRAAIVVLTTERIEYSTLNFQQVLEPLHDGGGMLSAIVLTNPRGSLDGDAARNRASVLDRGPRESGGVRFDVLTSQAYPGRAAELAQILKSQLRVVYSAPDSLIPPERFELSVTKAGVEAHGARARQPRAGGGRP